MPIFQDNRQLFARLKVIRGLFILVFLVLLVKVWYLSVVKADYYRDLADQNHVRIVPLVAPRGLILDAEGRVLVDNIQSSNLILFLDKTEHLQSTFQFLKGLSLTPEELEARLKTARNYSKFQTLVIKENLSIEEVSYILSHQFEHPELAIVEEPRRLYRYGALAAHAIGYVGEIAERQLKQSEFLGHKPGDIIGKYGVERTYNPILSGVDGQQRHLVNSVGKVIEELDAIEPKAGNPLTTTMDLDLQKIAEAELGDDPGAVVAFDPNDGKILVMASRPAFDPNLFARRISQQEWTSLIENPDNPLQNRTIQSQFSPGSCFKVVMALAGLERGVIDETTSVHCSGGVNLYGHYFHCWKPGGHGTVALSDAIRQSCNVYFYMLGQKLGINEIETFSRMVGLGQLSGIDLNGEALGLVPSENWKKRMTGEKWYAGETISVAIGQGPMNVTPIQLARAIGIIATGRVPALHLSATDKEPALQHPQVTAPSFKVENLRAVRQGMWRVVNEWGTGHGAQVQGFEVCGKTGTAQTIGNATRATLSKEEAAKFEPNAWFVGFAPRDNPEIVIAVIVQRGKSGGGVAAPIAGKIFQTYFAKRHRFQPQQNIQLASAFPRPGKSNGN
ncbi:MAG: penicillin-binding protein 2, partial [Acidobacteria bacterium]